MTPATPRSSRRHPLAPALAAGAVTAVLVGTLHAALEAREETRERVSSSCARLVRQENPGADVEVTSTERRNRTQFQVSGTLTRGSAPPEAFDCLAYSDHHGGWGVEMGTEATPK